MSNRQTQRMKIVPSLRNRLRESSLGTALWGTPKSALDIRKTKVMVLGAVEQSYGIYQVPTFEEQVNVLWNDPLVKEAFTMFAEQVVATGFFLTGNGDYKLKLGSKHQTALEVIQEWCRKNHIDTKLLEIAIELKAFGNSFWKIDDFGFSKIPIESAWHMVRVEPDVELQEEYNLQLTPIYGGKVVPWNEFIHFRIGITGYHAPMGQGVIYSLLAKPVDSFGNVDPSIYDIRLNMRRSLDQGFKNFSFGNVWVGLKNMSNEDFEALDENGQTISDKVANMSPTGNRIVTNTEVGVELEVPERTQSYDQWIKYERDEFFMSLADPSLKLGLEEGFTKATSVTASEQYKYKISTMRKVIKQMFEDLFEQILDKLGYDGHEADIELNFGPEETAEYAIADLFAAQGQDIITINESRYILSKYHKWDIQGKLPDGDKTNAERMMEQIKAKGAMASTGPDGKPKLGQQLSAETKDVRAAETQAATEGSFDFVIGKDSHRVVATVTSKKERGTESSKLGDFDPVMKIEPMYETLAGYNQNMTKFYIDPLVPLKYYALVTAGGEYEFTLLEAGVSPERAKLASLNFQRSIANEEKIDWVKFQEDSNILISQIRARNNSGPQDLYRRNN